MIRLCEECARRVIPKQKRRYVLMPVNEPFPGAMDLCADCLSRLGTTCAHPKARSNGGPGVQIVIENPIRYTEDGTATDRSERVVWPAAATGCRQREVVNWRP